MLRRLTLCLCAAALAAPAARGADLSLRATGSSRVSVSDDDGPAVSTSAGFAGALRTPRSDLNFQTGVSWSVDDDGGSFIWPNLTLGATHRAPRTTFTANLSFSPSPVRERSFRPVSDFQPVLPGAPLPDGFEVEGREVEALRLPLRINFGASRQIGPRDSVNLNLFYSLTEFTKSSPALTTARSWGASGGWNRQIAPDLSVGLSASATERHSFPRAGETASRNFSLTGNASYSLNSRFSVNGSLGPSLVQTLAGPNEGETRLGLSARGGLSYAVAPDLSFTASLSQSFDQNEDGELVERLGLSGGGSWRINARESARLNASASFSNPTFGGGDGDTSYVLAPGYSWSITPDVSLNASYRLRYDPDERGGAFDHAATLSLSYGYALIP